jgi:hypothetical protein
MSGTSSRTICWRGSSIASVRARKVRSAVNPWSLSPTTYRRTRSGSTISMLSGPTRVARSRGMRPEANTECSTPSWTTLKAASITPRFG